MRKQTFLLTVAYLLVWFASDALAVGFGFYGALGQGTIKLDDSAVSSWEDPDSDNRKDTEFLGAGMVLDTAVARDRVFNYRLNVGYEKMKVDFDRGNEIDLESGSDRIESLVIDQDFGLAVYRSDHSRLWFGPELRIFFSHDEFGMGIGPVLGLNLHTGREVSTALKLGFIFSEFADAGWVHDSDYEKESHAFVNLAILFRSRGDRYEKAEEE